MTADIQQKPDGKRSSLRSRLAWGLVLIGVGVLIIFFFGFNSLPGQQATFGLNLAHSQAIPVPDLILPVQTSIYVLALVMVFAGAYQLARGIRSIHEETSISELFI